MSWSSETGLRGLSAHPANPYGQCRQQRRAGGARRRQEWCPACSGQRGSLPCGDGGASRLKGGGGDQRSNRGDNPGQNEPTYSADTAAQASGLEGVAQAVRWQQSKQGPPWRAQGCRSGPCAGCVMLSNPWLAPTKQCQETLRGPKCSIADRRPCTLMFCWPRCDPNSGWR